MYWCDAAEDAAAPKPDPAEGLTFYTEHEEDSLWEPDEGMKLLLQQMNLLRTKPKAYAKRIVPWQFFNFIRFLGSLNRRAP